MSDTSVPRFDHAQLRSIVLPKHKVVFVPMPKGGCTSLLWLLADLAGNRPSRFEASVSHEVAPSMTIHDMALWQHRFRWRKLPESRRKRISADPDWFRFTTVRHPGARLWSAWQSKLLLREPSFAKRFEGTAWFPRVPRDPEEIVHDFRSFVHSLAADDLYRADVHWAPQISILRGAPPLTFVGKAESSDETLRRLGTHLGQALEGARLPRENSSLLRFDEALYDPETAEIVNDVFAEDFDEFDYLRLETHTDRDFRPWLSTAGPLIPAVASLVARHQRLTALQPLAAEARDLKRHNRRLAKQNRVLRAHPPASSGTPHS